MEEEAVLDYGSSIMLAKGVKSEEDDEDFRSCCEDEDELKEREESTKEGSNDELDEFSVKMYFKGVSIAVPGDPVSSGLSGIGVVMERSPNLPDIQVQKKLDFHVEQSVADYLALMDGLSEAMRNNIKRVFAFTDSGILFDQIINDEMLESPLLMALKQRIIEYASDLECFVLKVVRNIDLERPERLAQVAIGIVSFPFNGDDTLVPCSICCEEKLASMIITLKCCHKFCSHCMKTYVDGRIQSSQVPIRCPALRCKYFISTNECKNFLPVTSYKSLEGALTEADVPNSDYIYCPFPDCSALLDPCECLSTGPSSSNQSDDSCVECAVCRRFICVECGVPWHSLMRCEDYQNLPLEERDTSDVTLHRLTKIESRRRCQQCRRMIELTHSCYHVTCRCGHKFCYSCGSEYRDGQQTCQCASWEEEPSEDVVTHPAQQFEQWAWESFGSLSTMMDAYSEQERSQLALIQRFLAGGFGLSDHHPHQSPPRCTDSYVDAMKDLHQLPWLERFVSVISDNYADDYVQ